MTNRAKITMAGARAFAPSDGREDMLWDSAAPGLGLRARPNDGIAATHPGSSNWALASQARAAALAFLAREKGGGSPVPLPASGLTLTKLVAEYVERRSPSWKPFTVKATLSSLKSAILPALGHLRVGSVVRADIARFFHEYGRRKPGGANRSHGILRSRFDCAIAWGHRPDAAGRRSRETVQGHRPLPATAARAVARRGRSGEARRGPAPARRREPGLRRGGAPAPADGGRSGEIHRLRWREVKDDRLVMSDICDEEQSAPATGFISRTEEKVIALLPSQVGRNMD